MNDIRYGPLTQPAILAFSGPDATRYLNGQLTQDVSAADHDRALPSCITNAKGKLEYFVRVTAGPEPETIWISLPADQSDGLRDRLERYLIADEVEITDLTGTWQHAHADQPDPTATLSRRAPGPFGDGYDHWWPSDDTPSLTPLTPEQIEYEEIVNGWPRWNHELTPGMLPPEAGLDSSAISYQKGCYIGQEVLSRIKSIGRVNRRLAIFQVPATAQNGDPIFSGEKPVGTLTRVARAAPNEDTTHALGYLKKTAYESSDFSLNPATAKTVIRLRWA